MMHRIRFAVTNPVGGKLQGVVEADETYVGGKSRNGGSHNSKFRGHGTRKTPVFAAIQGGGEVHAQVVTKVNAKNLRKAMREAVDESQSALMTDDLMVCRTIGRGFAGGHKSVRHRMLGYSRGAVYVNTCESFFALIKRGVYGIYHNVSKKHLHRYVSEFVFRFNGRGLEGGERTVKATCGSERKRLYYRGPAA